MTSPTLTVIVPTVGRASLARTLQSVASQAGENDEILVVAARTADRQKVLHAIPKSAATWRLLTCREPLSNHGDIERNLAIPHANGTHLCFLDDDDIYLPGALAAMRDRATDVPVIFRMSHWLIRPLWNEPTLRFGNVSTQMFLVPNTPGKLGRWAPHVNTEGTDFTFITETCELQGAPLWDKRLIAQARPS